MMQRDLQDGQHRNESGHPGWFTTAYFHHPDDLAAEVAEAGLVVEAFLAIEGPGNILADEVDWMHDPAKRERLLRVVRAVEQEPSIMGASSHFMAVGRK